MNNKVTSIINSGSYNFYAYWMSDDVQSFFEGKKISVMGDSISTYSGTMPSGTGITYADFQPNAGGVTEEDGVDAMWWKRLATITGGTIDTNGSSSGSGVNLPTSVGTYALNMSNKQRIVDMAYGDGAPDIIMIYAVNDFGQWQAGNNTLGSLYIDGDPEKGLTDYAKGNFDYDTLVLNDGDFTNGWCVMLHRMMSTYPDAKIVVLEPHHYSGWNSKTYKYSDILAQLQSICDYFGIQHYPLSDTGITVLHPNGDGHGLITNYVLDAMTDAFLEDKYTVVLDKNYTGTDAEVEAGLKYDYTVKACTSSVGSSYVLADPFDDTTHTKQLIGWATTKDKADAGTIEYSLNQSPAALKSLKVGDRKVLYGVWSDNDVLDITVNVPSVSYTGQEQEPAFTTTMSEGDYQIRFYADSSARDSDSTGTSGTPIDEAGDDYFKPVGDYYLKAFGLGTYAGYTPVALDYSIEKVVLDLSEVTATYSGTQTIIASIDGVNEETVQVTYTLVSDETVSVGTYEYSTSESSGFYFNAVSITDKNYALPTLDESELIVAKKALTLTPQDIELTYGDDVPDWAQDIIAQIYERTCG